jgi:hypothetical protein
MIRTGSKGVVAEGAKQAADTLPEKYRRFSALVLID